MSTNSTETKKEKKRRATLEEFLRVILEAVPLENPDKTKESAASKLRLTVSSFDQRLRKEKQRYPEMFEGIDTTKFYTGRVGREVASPNEAWETLARIKGVSVEDLKKEIQTQNKEAAEKQEAEPVVKSARQAKKSVK